MSEAEFQALLAAIEQVRRDVSTPEEAREMLRREGYLTDSDEIADTYAGDGPIPRG